jgi:nucleolin
MGGGRGGRQKAAPGTRLFVGGLPREVGTDQLRELFASHGEMTDCIVLVDDAGVNRGFGFVTYANKTMAEAAVAALDGHKINGRRIGVRDADSDDKKKKKGGRRDPEGLKLYIGNLPFSATKEQLTTMVAAHATVNEIVMATDPSGKSKGFGFAFIKDMDKGEAVVKALNGTEMEGRKIKVDIAKAKGGKGNRGGDKGGKSARELQAIREEAEGGKKRKRRSRPKKD